MTFLFCSSDCNFNEGFTWELKVTNLSDNVCKGDKTILLLVTGKKFYISGKFESKFESKFGDLIWLFKPTGSLVRNFILPIFTAHRFWKFSFFCLHIFWNFQGKSIWRNSFLVELHVALLNKGFLIDVSCRNIS